MKPKRIQLSRTKGWRMPAHTVRVSRPSAYGNPFTPSQQYLACFVAGAQGLQLIKLRAPASIDRCLDLYAGWLFIKLSQDPAFLAPLRGKNLACWCALGKPCHADILLDLANR